MSSQMRKLTITIAQQMVRSKGRKLSGTLISLAAWIVVGFVKKTKNSCTLFVFLDEPFDLLS
jgi:hypothetical protein